MRAILGASSLLAFLLAVGATPAQQPEPRAVLEKAVGAHGGERLEKARVLLRKAKGEIAAPGAGVPFTSEVSLDLPDKSRWHFELGKDKQKQTVLVVVNGDKGWRAGTGAVKELSRPELEELQEDTYVSYLMTLLPLFDSRYQLTAVPETKVGNEPAVGFKVSTKGRPDVTLYFDKTTGLLVKTEHKGKEAGLAVTKEWLLSDCKNFQGLNLPTRCLILANGRKVADWTATEYQFPGRFEDAVFAKP